MIPIGGPVAVLAKSSSEVGKFADFKFDSSEAPAPQAS